MSAPHNREAFEAFVREAHSRLSQKGEEAASGITAAVLEARGGGAKRVEDVPANFYDKVATTLARTIEAQGLEPVVWSSSAPSEEQPADAPAPEQAPAAVGMPSAPAKHTLKHRFWAPNKAFEMGLDTTELSVYFLLCRRAGPTSLAWPSYNDITESCHINRRKVRPALARLLALGMIELERPATSKKPAWYRLTPPDTWATPAKEEEVAPDAVPGWHDIARLDAVPTVAPHSRSDAVPT